jgi:hypothetical protein
MTWLTVIEYLNIVSSEIYTLYAGAAGMLLHINGKFTMGKLKMILNMHMQVKTVQHFFLIYVPAWKFEYMRVVPL